MRHRFSSGSLDVWRCSFAALAGGGRIFNRQKLDLSFVPDDAVAAVVAHPQRMLTGPQAEMYPTEVISAATKKQVGFDPLEIEQGMMVIGLPDPNVTTGSRDPRGGFVLWFSNPIEMADVAAKIVPRGSDADVEGRKGAHQREFRPVFLRFRRRSHAGDRAGERLALDAFGQARRRRFAEAAVRGRRFARRGGVSGHGATATAAGAGDWPRRPVNCRRRWQD